MLESNKKRVAIVMTCHNRREKTLACLHSLLDGGSESCVVDVYLVDDGSTDGTGQAVKDQFPYINVLQGDGNLFWNRGMYKAFSTAVQTGYDFYLWVNDDIIFYPNAIDKLLQSYVFLSKDKKDIIITGPTMDSSGTYNTYGGFGPKKSIKPYDAVRIYMSDQYQECLIFHGNCVFIAREVVEKIGVNDPYYEHGYGDVDYSLMAARAGCKCWLANFPVGICERHDESFVFLDETAPMRERLNSLHERVNHPRKDEKYISKKFYGIWWPYKAYSADIRVILSSIRYSLSRRLKRHA